MFTEYDTYMQILGQDKSEHTVRSYRDAIENFLKFFSVDSLEKFSAITPAQVREYRDGLLASGKKNSSVNTYMRPLTAFANWLVENDYMETHVFGKVKALKEAQFTPDFLSKEEQAALVAATEEGSQLRLMVLFMLYTGVRRAELVSIKVGDISDGSVRVFGKGGKERYIPLPEFLPPMIESYLRKRNRMNKSDFLFTSKRRGETLTTEAVRVRIEKLCEDAGVRVVGPHVLRHTYATNLVEAGVQLNVISKLLGHASVLVTEKRYAAVSDTTKVNAVAKLPVLF